MHVKILPAFNGDAIWISHTHDGLPVNILIDGGTKSTYQSKGKKNVIVDGPLKQLIKDLKRDNQKIDLLILTHIDDDHIGGILKWIENDTSALTMIGEVWFNSGKTIARELREAEVKIPETPLTPVLGTETGVSQGVTFEKYIRVAGIWDEAIVEQGQCLSFKDLKFRMLSPSRAGLKELHDKWKKEDEDSLTAVDTDYKFSLEYHLANLITDPDDSVHNGSSIAFILTYQEKNLLFLADAHAQTLIDGLKQFGYDKDNPIIAEFVKISHHGSNRNISLALLEAIDCEQFIISTNGKKHGHPDKKGLAKILTGKKNPLLKFNYPERISDIFSEEDRKFITFRTASVLDGIDIV